MITDDLKPYDTTETIFRRERGNRLNLLRPQSGRRLRRHLGNQHFWLPRTKSSARYACTANRACLCVLVGEPGTGKSVIKNALKELDPKMLLTPTVNRTLHTYHSVLRILCEAFSITTDGRDFECETRLIAQADKINKQGKMLAPIIDDAHLMDVDALRRLRLVFEDFPKNHNLILFAQPELLSKLHLAVNEDLKSRVTYSVLLQKLAPDDAIEFILRQLDKVALGHHTFTDEALSLIARSSEGVPRRIRNLCIASMMEAVRDRTKTVDLKQVNRVLLQPHWRRERDLDH